MTIHFLDLSEETFCCSDHKHSELITKDQNIFTLADGESEFTVEQITTAADSPKIGWGMNLVGQILTALPRAIAIRKPIYQRCSPILLKVKVAIKPSRYDFLTLFFVPGGYSPNTHTYHPPKLEGDSQLLLEVEEYKVDEANLVRAIREEKQSKLGYGANLFAVTVLLALWGILWQARALLSAALAMLTFSLLLTVGMIVHSRKVTADLRKKAEDSVYYLNLAKK